MPKVSNQSLVSIPPARLCRGRQSSLCEVRLAGTVYYRPCYAALWNVRLQPGVSSVMTSVKYL